MSMRFFGHDNALDCLNFMQGLCLFDQIFILHFPCKQIPSSKIGTNRAQLNSLCVQNSIRLSKAILH